MPAKECRSIVEHLADTRPAQVEESIRFADGALAAAGPTANGTQVRSDARRALRGEISFDEAVKRAAARARKAERTRVAS